MLPRPSRDGGDEVISAEQEKSQSGEEGSERVEVAEYVNIDVE